MANEIQSSSEPNVTTLVSGIVQDAQELFKQQVALVRSEIKSDFQRTKNAINALAVGVGIAVMGFVLLNLTLVYLLHWAFPEVLPLWSCFAIVGGVHAILGGALIYAGLKKFESFNPLPDQSVEALKENLQWRTNPR